MYQRPRQSNRPAWWKNSILWIYAVATISQALGYFVTTLYLPTFATSLGLSNLEGTGALALLNGMSIWFGIFPEYCDFTQYV